MSVSPIEKMPGLPDFEVTDFKKAFAPGIVLAIYAGASFEEVCF